MQEGTIQAWELAFMFGRRVTDTADGATVDGPPPVLETGKDSGPSEAGFVVSWSSFDMPLTGGTIAAFIGVS
jgi:hypothetical protein